MPVVFWKRNRPRHAVETTWRQHGRRVSRRALLIVGIALVGGPLTYIVLPVPVAAQPAAMSMASDPAPAAPAVATGPDRGSGRGWRPAHRSGRRGPDGRTTDSRWCLDRLASHRPHPLNGVRLPLRPVHPPTALARRGRPWPALRRSGVGVAGRHRYPCRLGRRLREPGRAEARRPGRAQFRHHLQPSGQDRRGGGGHSGAGRRDRPDRLDRTLDRLSHALRGHP